MSKAKNSFLEHQERLSIEERTNARIEDQQRAEYLNEEKVVSAKTIQYREKLVHNFPDHALQIGGGLS